MTPRTRRAVGALLGALVIAALATSCGDDEAQATATPTPEATAIATASPAPTTRTATATVTVRTAATPTRTSTPVATASRTPRLDAFGEDIEAALARSITAKNYGAIGAYMTNPVRLTIESTGCCAPGTPGEAVGNLSRLNSATPPWNFDQDSAAVVSVKTRYPDNYGGSYVGISANGQVAAFKFNAANLIESIRLGDTRLLGP